MSFNLGDWAHQMSCETCAMDLSAYLIPPPPDLGSALPENFMDVPPDYAPTGYDPDTGTWNFDLPPPPDSGFSPGMIDGTPMLNYHGVF